MGRLEPRSCLLRTQIRGDNSTSVFVVHRKTRNGSFDVSFQASSVSCFSIWRPVRMFVEAWRAKMRSSIWWVLRWGLICQVHQLLSARWHWWMVAPRFSALFSISQCSFEKQVAKLNSLGGLAWAQTLVSDAEGLPNLMSLNVVDCGKCLSFRKHL